MSVWETIFMGESMVEIYRKKAKPNDIWIVAKIEEKFVAASVELESESSSFGAGYIDSHFKELIDAMIPTGSALQSAGVEEKTGSAEE